MENAPYIPPSVLEYLEEIFEDEIPMTDNPSDYFRAQGEQKVVRHLRTLYNKQRDNVLET